MQGYIESGEEDRRGDAQRAALYFAGLGEVGGVMVEMLLANGDEAGCGRHRSPSFFAPSRCHTALLPLNNP